MLRGTFGNPYAFNVKVYDMVGGGYYATINDGNVQVFQRKNSPGGIDSVLYNGGSFTNFLDHFLSFNYDATNKILTLSGSVDTVGGITYTRQSTYKFVSDFVIEDTYQVVANANGGGIQGTNWNYYGTINAIWDINNNNFGDGTSFLPLGIAVQLTSGGALYGTVSDSQMGTSRNNEKRALASQVGIASTWIVPGNGEFTLTANVPLKLTQWFFKSKPTFYDLMLQSTLAVAVAKGYTGTIWDQICQYTVYNNLGLMDNLTSIKILPSGKYNGMWCRDSFWASLLTNVITPAMENDSMNSFETNQLVSGEIPTMINTGGTAGQNYHDESNMLYIVRAYYDLIYRGRTPNMTVLTKAVKYIATQVTNDRWVNASGATQSWTDTFIFTAGGYEAYNQGVYAFALKCGLKLGIPGITQKMIDNAILAYQALYSRTDGYIHYTSDTNYLSTVALYGEALSCWFFGEKMLTDTQVVNHINKLIAVANTPSGLKMLCNPDGTFLSTGAFSPSQTQGDYQNGGSWFLHDYFTYLAGAYHGMTNAQALINERIEIEIAVDPVSHEYLQTDPGLQYYNSEPPDRHVYSWNAASFIIKQQNNLVNSNMPFATKPQEIF